MVFKIYNTLTRKKEEFKPLEEGKFKIYTCGQTIYEDMHIGNARMYSNWDILNRYLKWKGYGVFHVQNITDVGHLTDDADQGEDKVEKSAREKNMIPEELVTKQVKRYYREMDSLNLGDYNVVPRATGHIPEMIEAVEKIIENGYGYERNGSVYFDVKKFDEEHDYGKIARKNIEDLRAGAGGRVTEKETKEKKNPLDFALWIKADPSHIMKWKSPWSVGYPGWHLECSVMSTKYLGERFDIHGGGEDHMFPHHPNERAQNYAINNLKEEPVKYWVHGKFLTIDGEKMSKSKGNFYTVKDLLERYSGETLRMLFASSHYRKQMDFTEDSVQEAQKKLEKIYNTIYLIDNSEGGEGMSLTSKITQLRKQFEEAMDDDLNTGKAVNLLLQFSKEVNKSLGNRKEVLEEAKETMKELGNILGLKLEESGSVGGGEKDVEAFIDLIVQVRDKLREKKEYELSDEVRKGLKELGVEVQDTDDGVRWKKV